MTQQKHTPSTPDSLSTLVVRFAGDSGDGIQLTGERLARLSAVFGNDVVTLADFPAEIRAPAGTLYGVSGYQIHLGSEKVLTPGDEVDVLVVMNPAALRTNISKLRAGGILIANSDGFTQRYLEKAGYASSPLEEQDHGGLQVHGIAITRLTKEALKDTAIPRRVQERSKNFFALGLICWLTGRPIEPALEWIATKFQDPDVVAANQLVLKAGWNLGEAKEIFEHSMPVPKGEEQSPGTYRYVNGNEALAMGLVAAGAKSERRMVFGSYPITPASDILHHLAKQRHFQVTTFQAEDEMSAIGVAIGASFAGAIGVTATSGPGLALKGEFLNLAVMVELPLVVVNVQRAGPSTGMPTKMEQADLLMALWGRNGESPVMVLAPASPSDCFYMSYLAMRLAIKYMMPVMVLSDGFLANGAEAWQIPEVDDLDAFEFSQLTVTEDFQPYRRDAHTLARPWVVPGQMRGQHRIGGLEKEDITGGVSYDPVNHEKMVKLRAAKVQGAACDVPDTELVGPRQGRLLLLGWGSTLGPLRQVVEQLKPQGLEVAHAHLRSLQPFSKDLAAILQSYEIVLVVENNQGQLLVKLRAEFPEVCFVGLHKTQGTPFKTGEIIPRVVESYRKGVVSDSAR